jgi:hypothetical protein
VNDAYVTFLRHPSDPAGLAFWSNQLANGLRQEYMFAYFVGSAEYYARV